VALTPLVGRVGELEWVRAALRDHRLVTVAGPGGVGKTRLALEVARREVGRRVDGVWVVDLTVRSGFADVAGETARTLVVGAPAGATAADGLRAFLREREVLLVLDNCEPVVDACAALAVDLLGWCPGVGILATSRELLGVDGETVWRLEPLPPEAAHRLFVERARQRRPEFVPDQEMDAAIAGVCARLDRLPLAIELAAARVSVMSPAEILAALEVRLGDLGDLGGRGRRWPPRHRSVRAAVEWSYHLLDAAEQGALRSLAVFEAGFDADAARAVAPGLSVEVLARLVDKSLVVVGPSERARTRYRLLETIRECAHDLLVDHGELVDARARHLRHFAALCDRPEEGMFVGVDRLVNQLGDDYENLRAALEGAADSDPDLATRMFAGIHDLFIHLGQDDGARLVGLLLERGSTRNRHRAKVQIAAGLLAMLKGESDRATRTLGDACELCVELGEEGLEGWTWLLRGLTETLDGSIEQGRRHLKVGRDLHRRAGTGPGEARATAALGLTYAMENQTARAKELVEQALAIHATVDDRWGQGQCHTYLGIIAESNENDPRGATMQYLRAVECLRPSRDATLLPVALVGQAGVLVRRDPRRALMVTAAAWAIRARVGGTFAPFYRDRATRVRAAAEAALGPIAHLLWSDGARLAPDDAIGLAFGTKVARVRSAAGLSAREDEVARLVAEGLANKEIAARLHVSVRTVESHVRHALTKVGLVNRTQLAVWARERGQY
jgi:non-specific serine/threonine protein kinase